MLAIAIIMTVLLSIIICLGIAAFVAMLLWEIDALSLIVWVSLIISNTFCVVGTWILYNNIP